ncbi:hypothetical protein SOVF_214800, partial [Spinacia oleracea]
DKVGWGDKEDHLFLRFSLVRGLVAS